MCTCCRSQNTSASATQRLHLCPMQGLRAVPGPCEPIVFGFWPRARYLSIDNTAVTALSGHRGSGQCIVPAHRGTLARMFLRQQAPRQQGKYVETRKRLSVCTAVLYDLIYLRPSTHRLYNIYFHNSAFSPPRPRARPRAQRPACATRGPTHFYYLVVKKGANVTTCHGDGGGSPTRQDTYLRIIMIGYSSPSTV